MGKKLQAMEKETQNRMDEMSLAIENAGRCVATPEVTAHELSDDDVRQRGCAGRAMYWRGELKRRGQFPLSSH